MSPCTAGRRRPRSNGRLVTDAPYRIRPARPADLQAIQRIEQDSFTDPWAAGDFREALGGGVVFLVAETAAAVAGYVIARAAANEAEILNVAVENGRRGQGIARALIRQTLVRLAERGIDAVYLEVRESNLAARALYQRLGFQEVGRRRSYYRRPREDAVLLRTAIPAVPGDAKL